MGQGRARKPSRCHASSLPAPRSLAAPLWWSPAAVSKPKSLVSTAPPPPPQEMGCFSFPLLSQAQLNLIRACLLWLVDVLSPAYQIHVEIIEISPSAPHCCLPVSSSLGGEPRGARCNLSNIHVGLREVSLWHICPQNEVLRFKGKHLVALLFTPSRKKTDLL